MAASRPALLPVLLVAALLGACRPAAAEPTAVPSPPAASSTPRPLPILTTTPTSPPPVFELSATPAAGLLDLLQQSRAMRPRFADDPQSLETATRYWIDLRVELDPVQQVAVLDGIVRLRLVNPLAVALPDLVLYLWPNDRQYRSSMQVGTALVNGQPLEGEAVLGQVALRYALPDPLGPGET
ncbi:MAG TPA: hypothetical protein VJ345_06055, partial [Anaerolineales bacterium]|nr:hypothetical protein [Anaerolineales bacterium]